MADLPDALALLTVPDRTEVIASTLRNDFAATQVAVNALIAALSNGAAGQVVGITGPSSLAPVAGSPFANVKDFGAKGDGVTDDYAAIVAAIAAISGSGVVWFPAGTYLLSAELVITTPGVILMGAGSWGHVAVTGATQLEATHSAGSVIRVKAEGCQMRDFTVTSSAGRFAGAAGSNYGIRVEADDTINLVTQGIYMHRIRVADQPSHGIMLLSDCSHSQLNMVDVDNCKGHGYVIDSGRIVGRTLANRIRPGQIDFLECAASRLSGHSILCGNAAFDQGMDIPYRIMLRNFEAFYVATDPAVYLQHYNAYLFGENITTEGCGWSGKNAAGTASVVAGMWVAGRYHQHRNHRYINCAPFIAHVDSTTNLGTREIWFVGGDVENDEQADNYYNPAIDVVGAAVHNLTVQMHCSNTVVASMAAKNSTNYDIQYQGKRFLAGLPTADPHVASQMWSNAGVLTLSAG